MARPYSMDLRERVIEAVEHGGLSRNAAARRFGVAVSTAINWLQRHRETGSVAPGKMGGHKPRKLIGAHRVWLLERTKTDFTLRGLRAELVERGIQVDYRTVWSFAHDEGLSFKKKCSSRRTAPPKGRPQA
jgi:putative transposase